MWFNSFIKLLWLHNVTRVVANIKDKIYVFYNPLNNLKLFNIENSALNFDISITT